MKISCMNCQRYEFEVDISVAEIDLAKVVTLTCPNCGKSTALQERAGGGIEIALDKHLESKRS